MTRIKKTDSSQLHGPQSLENSLTRIARLIAPARRIAGAMERRETGPLFIGNQPSLDCAMRDLGRWAKASEEAFTDKYGGILIPAGIGGEFHL